MATAKKRKIGPNEMTDLELGGPKVFIPQEKKQEETKVSSKDIEIERLKQINPYRMITAGKRRHRKTRRKTRRRHRL